MPDAVRQDHLVLAGRYLELTQSGDQMKQVWDQTVEGYRQADVTDSFIAQEPEVAIAFYSSLIVCQL